MLWLTILGINLAFATLLLQHGANVVLADLTLRPESQAVVERYNTTPKAIFQRTDVTIWEDLEAMFKRALAEFGTVDIVCPGAGVFEPAFSGFWYPPGTDESKDPLSGNRYKSLDINMVHPIRTTQLAIAHFLAGNPAPSASNPKTVVHISSVAGETASFLYPLYHAAKWGLRGFVASLARLEERQGIRVAAVAPGVVKTPIWTDSPDKMRLVTVDGKVMTDKKWVTPEYVAEQMLALVVKDELVGPEGEKIVVQGGLMLEVGASHVREIPMFNNEPPDTLLPGMKVESSESVVQDTLGRINTTGWGMQPS